MNKKGFTALEVILMIVVLCIAGGASYLAYQRLQSDASTTAPKTTTPTPGEEKNHPYTEKITIKNDTHSTYSNSKLTYMFDFPKDWEVKASVAGDYLERVVLTSPDYKNMKYENGTSDTLDGAKIVFTPMSSYSGTSPLQFEGTEGILYKNGTLKPEIIKVGTYEGVEYSRSDEGPKMTYIRLLFGGSNNFIPTTFQAKDDEKASPYYKDYKDVLASVR